MSINTNVTETVTFYRLIGSPSEANAEALCRSGSTFPGVALLGQDDTHGVTWGIECSPDYADAIVCSWSFGVALGLAKSEIPDMYVGDVSATGYRLPDRALPDLPDELQAIVDEFESDDDDDDE